MFMENCAIWLLKDSIRIFALKDVEIKRETMACALLDPMLIPLESAGCGTAGCHYVLSKPLRYHNHYTCIGNFILLNLFL